MLFTEEDTHLLLFLTWLWAMDYGNLWQSPLTNNNNINNNNYTRYCDQASLFVGWFVGSFTKLVLISRKLSLVYKSANGQHLRQMLL